MSNLSKATKSPAKRLISAAENQIAIKIAIIGAKGRDQNLIIDLLPPCICQHQCTFLSKLQLEHKPSDCFDVIVFVNRCVTSESILPYIFNQSNKPVIVLSDCHDEQVVVESLYAGAHYYFNINESENILNARFEAALRSHTTFDNNIIDFHPYTFHTVTRNLYRNNQKIDLTHREFDLALYLFTHQGELIKDSDLLTWVWNLSSNAGTRRINTTVYNVSKKLKLRTTSAQWQLNRLYSQGYMLKNRQVESVYS